MAAVNLASWRPNVDAMAAALDVWRYVKDTQALSTLANAARDLNTLVGDVKNNKVGASRSWCTVSHRHRMAHGMIVGCVQTRNIACAPNPIMPCASQLPGASNAITNFLSAWTTYGPAFAAIIARVDSIQVRQQGVLGLCRCTPVYTCRGPSSA